ncbi:phosphate ABC transporter, periplasmic phosphate-binding protein [Leptolyngbya sp. NIES-3755]|nr:phosphate ABC transporter, periplasmic phosphate-binding protein [Leptolyngbya sp. NIES-3755]
MKHFWKVSILFILVVIFSWVAATPAQNVQIKITGGGSSFQALLYESWFEQYSRLNPTVDLSYQVIGSVAGIDRFLNQAIDFAGSDRLINVKERQRSPLRREVIQIPIVGRMMVLAYNLPGIENLRLSRSSYCAIVTGQIRNWSARRIAQDNPNIRLPNLPITFVFRADGSLTTLVMSQHLEKACPNWSSGVGLTVRWIRGIGARGGEGTSAAIEQKPGAIGYFDYNIARVFNLPSATLQNQAGQFVAPSVAAAAIALQSVEKDLSATTIDPPETGAYPIVVPTYFMLYERYDDPAKAEALKQFVQWALQDGRTIAEKLNYVPLPDKVVEQVLKTLGVNP